MFGYVTVYKDLISETEFNGFRAYYCGLCREMGKKCSQLSRLGLSYDMTFLAILLSSLNKDESETKDGVCAAHPFEKREYIFNDKALEYSAYMGVLLAYLKLRDDWKDERSIKALFGMFLYRRAYKKARRKYPDISDKITELLDELSVLEEQRCASIDQTADCFAKILSVLFTPPFIRDEGTLRITGWLGYNLGRWIYILDAYNDMEKDYKKNDYNPFLCKYPDKTAAQIKEEIRENIKESMIFTLDNIASSYELLNIYKQDSLIRHILYEALRLKQDSILDKTDKE